MKRTTPAYSIVEILIAMILGSIVLLIVFEGFISLKELTAKITKEMTITYKNIEFHQLVDKICYGADSTTIQNNQLKIHCDDEVDSINIRKDSIYIIGNDTIR